MATVGSALTSVESGMTRYDDSNAALSFPKTPSVLTDSAGYNGGYRYWSVTGTLAQFSFTGTKLYLIGAGYSNRSTNLSVYVDGSLAATINQYTADVLMYRVDAVITGLENKEHHVRIVNNASGGYVLDAIDTDGTLSAYNAPPEHRYKLTTDGSDSGAAATKVDLINNNSVTFSESGGASFNGSNQSLTGTLSSALSGDQTISFWLKPSSYPSDAVPWSIANDGRGIALRFQASAAVFYTNYDGTSLSMSSEWTSGHYPSDANTNIQIVLSGTTAYYYRNNVLVSSGTVSAWDTDTAFALGKWINSGQFYAGNIVDYRQYDYARNSDQRSSLYSTGANGDVAATIKRFQAIGGF